MHTYPWQDKYNVDLAAIDLEHKNLLACVNKLITAQHMGKSAILKLADEVVLYAEFHFLSEENLMYLTHYPDLASHSELHRQLIKQLHNKRSQLDDAIENLQDFVSFLVHWFVEHTQTVDRKLSAYIRNYQPAKNSPEYAVKKLLESES
ncbi:bacteriohemerythrin [Shewanella gelidii]|uniref:Hemerythrin-like domain-containing protein n=1 Tax=Shewanella gelidii TaxID=1642821 RepID=A0A917JJZ2_9GAMM|nr:hemerythrin family protein [Shewanella gelidii]MCL1097221.1 hemerythrin family protein [Shewanella gelidii]GGI73409.1 hypothetical protein GCM10009332_08660 [Shewanella gelidii]